MESVSVGLRNNNGMQEARSVIISIYILTKSITFVIKYSKLYVLLMHSNR